VLVEQEPAPAALTWYSAHAACLQGLDPVGEARQAIGEPVPRRLDRVFTVVGDARKGAELFELLDEATGMLFDVRVDSASRDHIAIVTFAQ
jgi:hypothetical protein